MVDKGLDKAFEWVDPIYNNIYLSVHTQKGDQFWNPTFGTELRKIKKVSGDSVLRARDQVVQATKWMIDEGIVKAIEVLVVAEGHRFNITVTVTKNDNSDQPYSTWFNIV